MKKFFHLLLFISILLSSCKEEAPEKDPQTPDVAEDITFTYDSEAMRFEESDIISLFAASDDDESYAENVLYSLSGALFTSDKAIKYPEEGSSLQFYALYPSQDHLSGEFEIAADQSAEQELRHCNLYVAALATNEISPELRFEGKAVEVEINCERESVEGISVAMQRVVKYDVVADSFEGVGECESITPCAVSDDQFVAVVAPQSFAVGSTLLSVDFGGVNYTWSTLSAATISPSSRCTFDITIESGDLILENMVVESLSGEVTKVPLIRSGGEEPQALITITPTEVRSTTVIVDVDADPSVGTYFLYSMPLEYLNVDYGGDLGAAAEGLLMFWTFTGAPLVVDNTFIFDSSIRDFSMADQTEDFSMDTDYVIFAFGVNAADYSISTDIYYIGVHTSAMTEQDRVDYSAWIGDWQVTSSSTYGGDEPLSFDITIAEDVAMESYSVTGWDQSIMGDKPIKVSYDVSEKTLNFPSESFLGTVDGTDELIVMRCFADLGHEEPSYITGVFSSLTAQISEDGQSAVASGYSGVISSTGAQFQISHIAVCGVTNYALSTEIMRLFAADEQDTPVDYPKGPYTMKRVSSNSN
ncbi:MAG: fimbrillin family protein [Rikenellaceae bacterium]